MPKATARKSAAKKSAHAGEHKRAHAHKAEEHTTEDVLNAFQRGRADAVEAAKRTLPLIKKSVSKGTYMSCYYLAFGVVYSTELMMSVVPEDSAIRDGFRDGSRAAKEAYRHRKSAESDAVLEESPA